MTRRQVWRRIAHAFGTPYAERTPLQQQATNHGLCYAWRIFTGSTSHYFILGPLGAAMGLKQYGNCWAPQYGNCWAPMTSDFNHDRALFACLMASMTDAERDELQAGL